MKRTDFKNRKSVKTDIKQSICITKGVKKWTKTKED